MTKRVTEQVAREKERISLAAGDSPKKAKRYAQEVRDGAAKRAAEEAK
jgi:hypothetical protein